MHVDKLLAELKMIKGRQLAFCADLAGFSNEQVCRQAIAGNRDFICELLRRAQVAEVEGDYLIANELYKSFAKGLL
ncbi:MULTISPECIES: hypothetical protein [unclassified Thalassotalea]|uniref:hypothetical protein n=1 Tax=unclassified Thalassotalea TaxID=2614972 RepID=UPI001081B567|nr:MULTISPECIES: hypothetical protein [unclassified Thalassotalea]NMP16871.1 hypothetical protein [Thalassotalea sp. Y01]QBY05469.1 hypothetical protein E2K93_14300 [Thalassotalea sp. HSM 43]